MWIIKRSTARPHKWKESSQQVERFLYLNHKYSCTGVPHSTWERLRFYLQEQQVNHVWSTFGFAFSVFNFRLYWRLCYQQTPRESTLPWARNYRCRSLSRESRETQEIGSQCRRWITQWCRPYGKLIGANRCGPCNGRCRMKLQRLMVNTSTGWCR